MDRRYNAAPRRLTALLLALALLFAPLYVSFTGAAAEVTTASVDYTSYALSASPSALNVTYYTNIYSRGFAWATDTSCTDTELFIVQSALGENAAFAENTRVESAACSAETVTITGQGNYQYVAHKAHVTDLAPGGVYSYKLGGNGRYLYGTFTVAPAEPQSISVLTLSDAQTKVGSLLYKWENCVAAGFATVPDADFVLYGGDQYDVAMNSPSSDNSIKYILRYGFAKDTIAQYAGSTPYMAAQGNHDNGSRIVNTGVTSDIAFAGTAKSGYYSFDYGFAHFAVVNTNDSSQTQVNWLQSDLSAAKANENINWIIVLMHNGPHSTGDHSADSFTPGIAERFTQIFSQNHVDLVLQGHDHTYSKTLPYRWDTVGRTTVYGDENIINYSPANVSFGNVTYDLNPNGTYYVTTGAS
ncbi:MAG: metallophosphoesterase, partial [Clostridia bacterium]|nr:metallophosphoesterase [Clostridia bacterium]